MGFLDRLLGRQPRQQGWNAPPPPQAPVPPPAPASPAPSSARSSDEQAIERYRYMLRTAPPDQIEQAHAEAFAKLTPEQRRQVLSELSSQLPESERSGRDDPRSLARMATRAEVRQPGFLERAFGPRGYGPGGGYGGGYGMGGGYGGGMGMGGVGMGGLIGGSLLSSVAGAFIGTAIADSMFDHDGNTYNEYNDYSGDGGDGSGDAGAEAGADGGDYGDAGYDDSSATDPDSYFGGGDDFGGGGDFGGDFGGGDEI